MSVLATFGFSVLAFAFVQNHSLNIKGGNKSKDGGIPFPKNGLTLAAFLDFIELNGGYDRFQGLTTTEVCKDILIKVTQSQQVSYCDVLLLLEDKEEENDAEKKAKIKKKVGKANVFVSHAWKYKFLDVISALSDHFKEEPDIFIWFDLFSNNQNLATDLPFEW